MEREKMRAVNITDSFGVRKKVDLKLISCKNNVIISYTISIFSGQKATFFLELIVIGKYSEGWWAEFWVRISTLSRVAVWQEAGGPCKLLGIFSSAKWGRWYQPPRMPWRSSDSIYNTYIRLAQKTNLNPLKEGSKTVALEPNLAMPLLFHIACAPVWHMPQLQN